MIFNLSQGGESTITVAAPSGATISATGGGESVSATVAQGSTSAVLKVHTIANWALTCSYSGQTKDGTVNIDSYGQSKSIQFSAINITSPSGYTVSVDGKSRTSSGVLLVNSTGSKSVSCSYSGLTTRTTSVTVSAGTVSYSVQFSAISITSPSGYTVAVDSVSRTSSGVIIVAGTGSKTVSCSYTNVTTKSTSVTVSSGTTSYSVQFSTMTVTALSGSTITCDSISRTGSGVIIVAGTGSKTVSCTLSGATDKSSSFTVSSGTTAYTMQFTVLNVTAPSGSTISCDGSSRSSNGGILVSGTGQKTVECNYDSVKHYWYPTIASGTTSYSNTFTYSCTISVTCPAGASVVASRSGYSNVTRTGSGSISVPKYGNWTVTVTIGSGTGQESKAATVYAEYDTTKSTSLYPKLWIYRANGDYRGAGLDLFDFDGVGADIDYSPSYADYTCSDGGNNVLITVWSVNLTGYTAIKIHCKLIYANRVELGLTAAENMYNSDNWVYRNKIHNLVSADHRVSLDWATYSINISSTANLHPIFLNLGGGWIPGIQQDKDSEVEIDEWWLE